MKLSHHTEHIDRPRSAAQPAMWTVAAARCRHLHGHQPSTGIPACRECLTIAEAADAAAAAEAELDSRPPAHDPFLVDEVAVERAMRGEAVTLSPYEWFVVRRLLSAELTPGQMYYRLKFGGVKIADSLGTHVPMSECGAAVPLIPSDHVEDLVVEARLSGTPVELTPHELNAAVQRLAARGMSHKAIGRRLGMCDRSVAKALRSRRDTTLSAVVAPIGRVVAVPAASPVSPLPSAA